MWSMNDLKNMTDSTSAIYWTVIQVKMSDKMTYVFKKDLKLFKLIWCKIKTLLKLSH